MSDSLWKKTLTGLRRRASGFRASVVRFNHRSTVTLAAVTDIVTVLVTVASIAFVCLAIVYGGYYHSHSELQMLFKGCRWIQALFCFNIIYNLAFNFRRTVRTTRSFKWVVDGTMLLSLLPWIYPHPENPWLPWLERFLYSNIFLFTAMGAYSVLSISFALIRVIGKRTNPSLLLSSSFLVVIAIGTFLLMLPNCTYTGIDFIDALFVSTSAVCITGLTPVDVSLIFTPFGTVILCILIQIGALGVMTFTSFFALFFSGTSSIYSQLMLKDIIYSRSMNALIPTLLYILSFTLVVELMGALAIFLSIHGTMPMTVPQEIGCAVFHSVSAFSNAGFSTIPDGLSNPALLHGNISIYWIVSALIIAGSIGFPILVNFKDIVVHTISKHWQRLRGHSYNGLLHIWSTNTKITLVTFGLLFVTGAVAFFVLESPNTMRHMTLLERITQSVFNSATPRSAGFSSVNPARFLNVTLVIVMFLMWVGGSSQSTGGGIKVNTLAAIWLNLRAIVTGRSQVTAFHRSISVGSIRRANAVVAISIFSYFIFSVTIFLLDPHLSARDILFEVNSAVFTVGSSLGITSQLCAGSKAVLCVAMFLGRVGIISLLTGIASRRDSASCSYPSDNIIIS